MKNSFFRLIGLSFIMMLSSVIAKAQTTDNANPTGLRQDSGYGHRSNQNNWGLFGIIGVIAIAGVTRRNLPQKN